MIIHYEPISGIVRDGPIREKFNENSVHYDPVSGLVIEPKRFKKRKLINKPHCCNESLPFR
jgi:hypothetical protein